MALTIKESLEQSKTGFHIGHRLILPFKCNIIKVIFGRDNYTELVGGKNIKLHQDPMNTSIYVRSAGKLDSYINSHKHIKLICAELDSDLTDINNHIKLILSIKEAHVVEIEIPGDDVLFIE